MGLSSCLPYEIPGDVGHIQARAGIDQIDEGANLPATRLGGAQREDSRQFQLHDRLLECDSGAGWPR